MTHGSAPISNKTIMKPIKFSVFPFGIALPVLSMALMLMPLNKCFAQHAVRDDFPNGKERGELFEHFTKAAGKSRLLNMSP
jgi:hypothetical protein